jgi:pseudouridine synthase
VLLNKPRGVITTLRDTHERKTVADYVARVRGRVFPVGRLDKDAEGALLLTNDGELAYRLTHPKYQIDKVYLAWVEGIMMPETVIRLEKGVPLEDGLTAPAVVKVMATGRDRSLIRLTLREGRKREIKRMCAEVGHPVRKLERISIGNVRIKGLKSGEWRYLSESELNGLRKLAGLLNP